MAMANSRAIWHFALAFFSFLYLAASQDLPSTYPHVYPGAPSGGYSPLWQKCEYYTPYRGVQF